MKKTILFLMILGLFIACDNNHVINENPTNNNSNDTTSTTVNNNEDEQNTDNTTPDADSGTVINPEECYWIQATNDLGEPVDMYECILFEKKAGRTFEEAFEVMCKEGIDELVRRQIEDEKKAAADGYGNYNPEQWELRQVQRIVRNTPNEKLVFTSIELYMFSKVYQTFTIVYSYCVIDSEGNVYLYTGPLGGEDITLEPPEE